MYFLSRSSYIFNKNKFCEFVFELEVAGSILAQSLLRNL